MTAAQVSEHDFAVIQNVEVAQDTWRMRCKTALAALVAPGQFVNVLVPGDQAHILRVPLSFARTCEEDATLELVYAVVGEGTRRLSRMREGDHSSMVGPCGSGWKLSRDAGRALLVAGGVGLPPVVACARMLAQAGVVADVVVGAQTAARHVDYLIEELATLCDTVVVCSDDGSRGVRGLTTTAMDDLLSRRSYGQVYSCGPAPMMAGVARLALDKGVACQVSLERMMGCGFGACSCCNVALAGGGYALCCQDGPVFDAREVAW